MGEAMGGQNGSTITTYLNRLENEGYIYRRPGISRCIRILKEAE
jgi:SOS-response transcriptional repressor LexA